MNFMSLQLEKLEIQKSSEAIFHHSTPALEIKNQLVPNFDNLSEHQKLQITEIITMLLNTKDITTVQRYCRKGGLDPAPLLRSHVWKILLQTLPVQSEKWASRKKQNYQTYLKLLQREPLDSINFDKNLWNEIEMDTLRTHSDIQFFKTQVNQIRLYPTKITHNYDVLTRILYVWARLSGGVRYVQGMNEILAPLYYLEFQTIKKQSQSQVFFMFSSLITSLIDMHIKDMDKSQTGINGHIHALNKHLKAVDFELWSRLQTQNIVPQFYSFRWLALMLCQQFEIHETMRLWDILLSRTNYRRFKCLYAMCITIMELRKQFIMQKPFSDIMQKLQKIEDLKARQIIDISQKLYQKLVKIDIQKTLRIQQEHRKQKQQSFLNRNFFKKMKKHSL